MVCAGTRAGTRSAMYDESRGKRNIGNRNMFRDYIFILNSSKVLTDSIKEHPRAIRPKVFAYSLASSTEHL